MKVSTWSRAASTRFSTWFSAELWDGDKAWSFSPFPDGGSGDEFFSFSFLGFAIPAFSLSCCSFSKIFLFISDLLMRASAGSVDQKVAKLIVWAVRHIIISLRETDKVFLASNFCPFSFVTCDVNEEDYREHLREVAFSLILLFKCKCTMLTLTTKEEHDLIINEKNTSERVEWSQKSCLALPSVLGLST